MAITEKLDMAPPENMSRRPRRRLASNTCFKATGSTLGTGTWAAKRNMARIKKVTRSLRLRSGNLKALRIACIISTPPC